MHKGFIVILFLTLILASLTQQLHHITSSTNCTIVFGVDSISNTSNGMKFEKCVRNICIRNLANGNCVNLETFRFEEQKCYWQCCHSDIFDFVQCQDYNRSRQIAYKQADERLALILLIVMFGLLTAILIFALFYLQCCTNNQDPQVNTVKQNQFQWKECKFNADQVCQICNTDGAFVMIACGKFYHLKCLSTNENWLCKHCDKSIKRVKIFCPICQKRTIMVDGANFQQLDKKVLQLYQFHPEKCIESMDFEMDTERKFTQTTKQ